MGFIEHNFGGYRAYITHLKARAAAACGRYAALEAIDWRRVERLVFVCKGNVCRSPYAEGKTRMLGWETASFGLNTTGDVPANPAALRNAQRRGVDLASHRSTQFDPARLRSTDLLLGFEPAHLTLMRAMSGAQDSQMTLVGLWREDVLRPVIADPYGKSDSYFQACFEHIDGNVAELVRLVRGGGSASSDSVANGRQK